MIGKRGMFYVVKAKANSRNGRKYWLCQCDCGKEFETRDDGIKSGKQKSCGCYNDKLCKALGLSKKTHGQAHNRTKTYTCWANMIARCTNPKSDYFHHYGGRGISVCEKWSKFENFLDDMGEVPDGLSLDRIDVNGNYEPGNCRWATSREQRINQRPSNGMTKQNRSGFVGVSWNKNEKKWVASFGYSGKQYHVGYFSDLHSAVEARRRAKEMVVDQII